jgi:hypothetical protein
MGGVKIGPLSGLSTRVGAGGLASLLLAALALASAPPAGAVTGGTQIPITDAPWQVEMATIGENGFQYCGGTIISDRLVLTTAHCVAGTLHTTLYAGDSKYNAGEPAQQEDQVKGTPRSYHDLAVLELETPLHFGAGAVEPIALVPSGAHWPAGTAVQVTGYGQHQVKAESQPNESLYSLSTKLLPSGTCGGEADALLCTETSGGTTCFGDSGSGLTLPGTSATLIGIVDRVEPSSGETCTAGSKDDYVNLAAPAVQQFIGIIPASEGAPKAPSAGQNGAATRSSVRLGATKLSVSGGSAIVKLDCSGSARCKGKLTLTVVESVKAKGKTRKKTVTLGSADFSVAGGGRAKVKIKLSTFGRAQVRTTHGHLKAVLGILGYGTEPTHKRNQDVTIL